MSTASANAFVEKMKADQDFASRIIEADSKNERRLIAQSEGFSFTADELSTVLDSSSIYDSIDFSQHIAREGCSPESCCS